MLDGMTLTFSGAVLDCADPTLVADFWQAALGWTAREDGLSGWVSLEPGDGGPAGGLVSLFFQRVPEGKVAKNRLHLDFTPDDQQAEFARLEALGARRIDIGQGDPSWVVLADVEGNEFCVLSGRS